MLEPIVENRYLAYMPKFETEGTVFNARWDGYFMLPRLPVGVQYYTPAGYCNSIEVNGKEVFSFDENEVLVC